MKLLHFPFRLVSIFFLGLLYSISLAAPSFAAPEDKGPKPIKVVEIITVDDSGGTIQFPSYVYYDDRAEETYILTGGGNSKIAIFGPDYFPEISLGPLRGIYSANSMIISDQDKLYVCQGATEGKKNRVTILNAAFFIQKEIILENIPGVTEFTPSRIALSREGTIYLAGYNAGDKGVLVLDAEGRFLRWLTPKDKIQKIQEKPPITGIDLGLQQATKKKQKFSVPQEDPEKTPQSESAPQNEEVLSANEPVEEGALPSSMMPKIKDSNLDLFTPDEYGPVAISDVLIDGSGNIYLLSEEKGKIYVYSSQEQFLFSMGQKGGSSGKMSRPRGFALDKERGYVYVVDYMRHSVLVYNMRTGRFMFEFGGRGTSPGWFNFPTSVAVDRHGNVIVADLFNRRVQVLDINVETTIPVLQYVPGSLIDNDEGDQSTEKEKQASPEEKSPNKPELPSH